MPAADKACVVPPRPVSTHGGGLGIKRQASGTLSLCRVPSGEVLCSRSTATTSRDGGPSDDFPVVGCAVPYEVVPMYGSIMDSGDVSSICSSAYSFAPIKPALRDEFTDLEVHEVTRQEMAAVESRTFWTSNPFHLATPREEDEAKQGTTEGAGREDAAQAQAAERAGRELAALAASGRKGSLGLSSKELALRRGASVPALPRQAVDQVADFFNSCGDVHAITGSCSPDAAAESANDSQSSQPIQQATPVKEVPMAAGPMMTFWDVDSRGSAGLNFVFVDDGSVRGAGMWHDDAVTSSSTTLDSAVLTTADMQLMVAQALSPRPQHSAKCPDLWCCEDAAFGDGQCTPMKTAAGLYNVQFDFVSNSFSADQLESAMATQPGGRFVPLGAAQPSATELLSKFLRSTTTDTERLLAATRVGISEEEQSVRFVELDSCDNASRPSSDSEASEGRGRSMPGVAIYRNKLFDFGRARARREVPTRDNEMILRRGESAKDHPTSRQDADKKQKQQEGDADPKKSSRGCSCPAVESFDSAAKPPRMRGTSTDSRRHAPSCAEIEPAEEENHEAKKARRAASKAGALPARSQLYDSSRSWVGLATSGQRLICHTNRSYVDEAWLDRKKLRKKYERRRRLSVAIARALAKLLTCFQPGVEQRQWP
ncbi:unnamed protein product [Ostreobium quekettii]|uniref:Uncharacterized protein n=1 Tax=Ostreobium quekettii TaxID=121088 RepID=A0A8S1IN11_9CHLO|nr:unnamed protein product [Ostreobium quekettii]CAD7697835.1 unnamed protein product [Ostreobium quekettii]|eukprot:evm.model.scf_196.6 EVM.evm.TU.scf_196.6   scf_196:83960-85927(-)